MSNSRRITLGAVSTSPTLRRRGERPRAGDTPGPVGAAGRTPARRGDRGRTGAWSDDSGFTLVEMLVVVLVLGALVGIAVPTFVEQRDRAWDAAVRSELRAAGVALESFRAQNGEYSEVAIEPGAEWGFSRPATLTLVTETVVPASYCLIGHHADATGDSLRLWMLTPAGLSDAPVESAAACPTTAP